MTQTLTRMMAGILFVLAVTLAGCGGSSSSGPAMPVGDDTYVPDFQAGNLSFTDVWVPDTAQAGYPVDIWFNVEAEKAKYNTYVRLDLVKLPEGNASDLVIDPEAFAPDYHLTAVVINNLAQGEQRKVEHSFVLPPEVANGTYAAVFTINSEDYFPEDDALQGEAGSDLSDNYLVAPASIIIGQPDLPNLRVLDAQLNNNSFGLSPLVPVADGSYVSDNAVLTLNLEVESMGQDTVEPVDIIFDLEIDGNLYPLVFTQPDESGEPVLTDTWTYPQVCEMVEEDEAATSDEMWEPVSAEDVTLADVEVAAPPAQAERCASLFRQSQVGHSYALHLPDAAYAALEQKAADTPCQLIVTIDPDNTITEWEGNKSDNVKALPVMFLPADEENQAAVAKASANGPYQTKILDLRKDDMFGNSWFAAGYDIGPDVSYQKHTFSDGFWIPKAGYAGAVFNLKGRVFKNDFSLFNVWGQGDVNLDNITGSAFDYGASVMATRIWGRRYGLLKEEETATSGETSGKYINERTDSLAGQIEAMTLWESKDENGDEKYAKSKTFFDKSRTFWVYCIPVQVRGKAKGEVGIKGAVTVEPENTMALEFGPYGAIVGTAEGAVNALVAKAGVGSDLKLIELAQKVKGSMQLQPLIPLALFRFSAPLSLESLSGNVYLFGDRLKRVGWFKYRWKRKKWTMVTWKGFEKEWNWFQPKLWRLGYNHFLAEYWKNTSLSGDPDFDRAEGILNQDWSRVAPKADFPRENFSARYTGKFNFDNGTYKFDALADDGIRVWIDGVKVIDDWSAHPAREYSHSQQMSEGEHDIKVEYYQKRGDAKLSLIWQKQNS